MLAIGWKQALALKGSIEAEEGERKREHSRLAEEKNRIIREAKGLKDQLQVAAKQDDAIFSEQKVLSQITFVSFHVHRAAFQVADEQLLLRKDKENRLRAFIRSSLKHIVAKFVRSCSSLRNLIGTWRTAQPIVPTLKQRAQLSTLPAQVCNGENRKSNRGELDR